MQAPYLVAPERFEQGSFVLRPYHPGDGQALADALNASYAHLKRFMPWAAPHQTPERCERQCREFYGRYLLATDFVLGVWSADESRLLGGCGYHLREGGLELKNAELGMWIRSEAAHAGLGTAVLGALLAWGFTAWPWERLTWRCSNANLASQRVAEKCGLQREGILRSNRCDSDGVRHDTICYAALRQDAP